MSYLIIVTSDDLVSSVLKRFNLPATTDISRNLVMAAMYTPLIRLSRRHKLLY